MRRLITTIAILTFVLGISAQISNPVHFSAQLKTGSGADAEIVFTAKIDAGWHVYSTELGNNGPISATFNAVKMDGVETIGKLQARGKEIKQYDKLFEMELRYFEQAATFVQKVKFTKPDYDIDCYLEYGACNDQACLPPSEVAFKQKGKSPTVKEKTEKAEDVTDEVTPVPSLSGENTDTAAIMTPLQTVSSDSLWSPVVEEFRAMGGNDAIADHSLLYILLMGFIGGLLAVCMPCIWPIIPMTVSFFLKRAKSDKKKGIRDAFTYGISIIVIYLGLGLLVTALFGSDTLNAMSTNAVFNIFLFLLLVVFALSFFGWFEIKLPESWANSVDTKATETSGLISIFLMAFTLVLVSFSCTAPIIGLLLVETTTSGNWLAPALGMLGFAVALALPFTLFAMFPSWLKQAPKSGSWMNTLKIVLGFIELAFALKFFSVADLAYGWHLLDREVFLSLWIVIFALLGAYLCGWLKFQTDEIGGNLHKPMPVVCIMGGLVSLAFAVYMIPGLWGAPCKAVSAFAPPMNTQDFNLNTKTVEAKYTDYDEGMAAAKALGKPVLIDFTGFGCVNCRKMEAAVWTDPTVADMLTDDFVLISLYVDDKTPLAEPLEVITSQDETKILRTVGAKWSWLQSQKFGANAQPFYVMLDNNGKPLSASRAYDEDVNGYINFLKQGLLKYQQ
ncbi:thiol:disulfide interchange protein DsbD [Prevotella sp. khp7]|uniref:protein-disulfide reductase DsbD family protein n=1 Tax=Prevotella sp. khp7 TaxID=1761885 RepID=UPI0008D73E16|nr:cytochrome c biogenesis protein CcdA [Prevotella sp. khp7]SEV88328.1 thiol:disulfide interchange protein DsbD [Prevotella sp. khp7]